NSGQTYREEQLSASDNWNHRLNLKIEYKIDSLNELRITPRVNFQQNKLHSELTGNNYLSREVLSSTTNQTAQSGNALNADGDITFNHKFMKDRRTISLSLIGEMNVRNTDK